MKNPINVLGTLAVLVFWPGGLRAADRTIPLFDKVLFYDGYAAKVEAPTAEGVVRHRNDLYAVKLKSDELKDLGSELQLQIEIGAACDNYDRIGNFNLAFVPKGAASYVPGQVMTIEAARFITPFMDKNKQPDRVPYAFQINHLVPILNHPAINANFDIWAELELFGIPYAANKEVAGCQGRNDVFFGSASLVSNGVTASATNTQVISLNFKNNLNNYAAGASDEIGKTRRTITFQLDKGLRNARLYLITSNHGANPGGEEYNRRFHEVYFDGRLIGNYIPGGESCEPYRVYNTQGNGIYGPSPKSPQAWAEFSNWCPGKGIPIREFSLGDLPAGEHRFQLSVPNAVFVGQQGYIPVSLSLQGETSE